MADIPKVIIENESRHEILKVENTGERVYVLLWDTTGFHYTYVGKKDIQKLKAFFNQF